VAIAIEALGDETKDLDAYDRILIAARGQLVRPGEHLPLCSERLGEPDRLILGARLGDVPAGLLDLALHHPEPGTATAAVIAVDPQSRLQGIGRALVEAAVERIGGECPRLAAGVHAEERGAITFWLALGLAIDDDRGGIVTLSGTSG